MKTLHHSLPASESSKHETAEKIQPLPTWLTILIVVLLALMVLGVSLIWL